MKERYKIQITKFLKEKIPNLFGIYVYGSYADNTFTNESDIDIAFLSYHKIPMVEKWKIQEELASILGIDVDLTDLKDATTILRVEIIEKGILIYTGDSYKLGSFETTTYSMYADLNESRRDILTDYREKYGRDSDK